MTPDEVQLAHDAIVSLMDEMGRGPAADWYVINEALIMLAKNGAKNECEAWVRGGDGLPHRVQRAGVRG